MEKIKNYIEFKKLFKKYNGKICQRFRYNIN